MPKFNIVVREAWESILVIDAETMEKACKIAEEARAAGKIVDTACVDVEIYPMIEAEGEILK